MYGLHILFGKLYYESSRLLLGCGLLRGDVSMIESASSDTNKQVAIIVVASAHSLVKHEFKRAEGTSYAVSMHLS